ncbi:hypothetical protein, partial [Nocardia salmonicida]|uniref:hypothetical protein n=1 Tax=Nocardia salmonicida TaxID=53431 RepID=UPI0033C6557D
TNPGTTGAGTAPSANMSQPTQSSLVGLPPVRPSTENEREHRSDPSLTTAPTVAAIDQQESPS